MFSSRFVTRTHQSVIQSAKAREKHRATHNRMSVLAAEGLSYVLLRGSKYKIIEVSGPKSKSMGFGTRDLKYWLPGASGLAVLEGSGGGFAGARLKGHESFRAS